MAGHLRMHIVTLSIAALAITACSSSTPAQPSVPPTDSLPVASVGTSSVALAGVCALLTLEEAEQAFGQTFNAPVGQDGEPSECRYFNSAGFGLQVEVSRAPTVEADYEAARTGFGARAEDLPGVGDQAFEYFQGRRQVMFLKGDALVTLYSASRVEPDVFRALARTVADRM